MLDHHVKQDLGSFELAISRRVQRCEDALGAGFVKGMANEE